MANFYTRPFDFEVLCQHFLTGKIAIVPLKDIVE
jgi:hypothetical protein